MSIILCPITVFNIKIVHIIMDTLHILSGIFIEIMYIFIILILIVNMK